MKKKKQTTLAPTEVHRETQLLAELHALDAALDANHAAMIRFRSAQTVMTEGHTDYRASDPSARAEVEEEWNGYVATPSRLIQNRTKVWQEWGALKASRRRDG